MIKSRLAEMVANDQPTATAHILPPPLPFPSLSPAGLEDGEEEELDLREHGRAPQQHAGGDGGLDPEWTRRGV